MWIPFKMYSVLRCLYVLCVFHIVDVFGKTLRPPTLLAVDSQGHGIRGYHGYIEESEHTVSVYPPLRAKDPNHKKGCIGGYKVYKSGELPFKVELKDRQTGEAEIIMLPGATKLKEMYKFLIAAYLCDDENIVSKRIAVTIRLKEQLNKHAPEWPRSSEVVEVLDGHIYPQIIRLNATDKDISKENKHICIYHILNPGVPFKVSKEGVLRNTQKLDYNKKRNYILEVQAEDCGGRKSRPLYITVKVKETCKIGWKGIPRRVNYSPGSERRLVAEGAKLELCDTPCHHGSVTAKITLQTSHIGKGCDRDTYSIQSQRKLCGASSGGVDLLPTPRLASWTKTLPTDDGLESDQIYAFDGKTTAVEVPEKKFNHTLDSHFTISVWMKHRDSHKKQHHGDKEHILCNSDGSGMNRHHYSLFVRNCRLVFLLRQEYHNGQENVFKPAEWRWSIPQACDGEWHHYAVSIDFPKVRLYIDGRLFDSKKENFEVVDDWPLHKTKQIHFTKLVIGACWQGGEKHLDQYFHGYLAGLSLLKGKTESDRVIKCLNNCKEKLDFHAMRDMETGMSVGFNSAMTEITINGKNHSQVEKLVRRVGYINYRMFPTPGYRELKIVTDVKCEGEKIEVKDHQHLVMVQQAEKPIISITGTPNQSRTQNELGLGVHIFRNVNIVSRTKKEQEEEDLQMQEKAKLLRKGVDSNSINPNADYKTTSVEDDKYKLDSCIITLDQEMKEEIEFLRYPHNLIHQLGLEVTSTKKGLMITGADKIYNYEDILRHIHYVHNKPEVFTPRTFKLVCTELNGRFVSNEYTAKLDVVHKLKKAAAPQAHVQQSKHFVSEVKHVKELHLEEEKQINNVVATAQSTTGVGMTVIIVVCVGFLIFMIVLGVIRIRAAHQRSQVVNVEERQEMEWDNSALNIIVNPMEQEAMGYSAAETNTLHGEDSDSDDDDASSCHDELESSEDESEKIKDRELEWDDSTLSF